MHTKDIIKKQRGAESIVEGPDFEIVYFVAKLVDLLISYERDGDCVVFVRRGGFDFPVDDLNYRTKNNINIYSQCKSYYKGLVKKEELKDFVDGYKKDRTAILEFVSINKPKYLDKLCNFAQNKYPSYQEFWKEVDNNVEQDLTKQLNIIKELFSDLDIPEVDKQVSIFEFLKQVRCISAESKTDSARDLIINNKRIAKDIASNICSIFYKNGNNDWFRKDITVEELKKSLKDNNIDFNFPDDEKVDAPDSLEISEENTPDIFLNKLNDLLIFTKTIASKYDESHVLINEIKNNFTITWHFFKNLKDPKSFTNLNKSLLPYLTALKSEHTFKAMLVDYLKLCAKSHGDDIVPLVKNLIESTKSTNLIIKVLELIGELDLKNPESIASLNEIIKRLVKHQDSWLRARIPQSLRNLAKYDFNQTLQNLESIMKFKPLPQDVVRGDPTLRLKFSGRDNENTVHRHAIEFLSDLLRDADKAEESIKSAIKLENYFLLLENRQNNSTYGMKEDYSYIWFKHLRSKDMKYESDMKERIPYEVLDALKKLVNDHKSKVDSMLVNLLATKQEVFYIIMVQFAESMISSYPEYAKEVIFNRDFWWLRGVRRNLLQNLITKYLDKNPKEVDEFYRHVLEMEIPSKPNQNIIKQDLIFAIPKKLKTNAIINTLKDLERTTGSKSTNAPLFYIGDVREKPGEEKVEDLNSKTDSDLVKMAQNFKEEGLGWGMNKLALALKNLIVEDPYRSKSLLKHLGSNKLDQKYSNSIVEGIIQSSHLNKSQRIELIQGIIHTLGKDDRWAKKQIIDFVEDEARDEHFLKLDKKQIKILKNIAIKLSYDLDPETDRNKKDDTKSLDAINHAINTVRGKAIEVLILLLHSSPGDEKLKSRIAQLSKDSTDAVKANLIYNLKYLIADNYAFCKQIVDKFVGTESEDISFALLNYYSNLGKRKFKSNLSNVNLLFNNTSKEILSDLGELYAYRVIADWGIDRELDEIIKGYRGDTTTRRSIAFVLESHVEEAFNGKHDIEKILSYLEYLTDPDVEIDMEVRERAAYFLDRPNLSTKFFKKIESSGIFSNILKDKDNVYAQSHLINYFVKCVTDGIELDSIIEYIEKLVLSGAVLVDSLVTKDVVDIVTVLLKSDKLTAKSKSRIKLIISKGVEKGYDEFYKLYADNQKLINGLP